MKKVIVFFAAIVVVAVCIEWYESCGGMKSHKAVFARQLAYAHFYQYKDADYDYVVSIPSFFMALPDSLQEEKGRMRFEYGDEWISIVIESHVMSNEGRSLRSGMDSLAQELGASYRKLGSDGFILAGQQYENGNKVEGYSYYTKVVACQKLWFVYTMIYPDDYKDALTRLFKEIGDWQVWEHPHLPIRQGEEQTPKARRRH